MNGTHRLRCMAGLLIGVCVCLILPDASAFAGDNPAAWRPIYDLVMRWVNFLILAFVIVKFGRAPLMTFLKGQQEETRQEIDRLEKEKRNALEKVEQTRVMIAESNENFKVITERIITQGEKRKQEIIDEAAEESRLMFESAKHKIAGLLARAKEQYREELVDAAVYVAGNRLAEAFSEADNAKSIERFVDSIENAL